MPHQPAGRAVELHGDGSVRIVERPYIEPGADQLLIEVRSVGLCATDKEIRDGTMSYFRHGLASYPVVPGHEWVGEVVEIGSAVEGFDVGDRVVGECSIGCANCETCRAGRYHMCAYRQETGLIGLDGALGRFMLYPARAAHVVPAGIGDLDATLIEPAAVAYNTVAAVGMKDGEDVIVVGAGPIGLLCVQIASALGAHTVAVADPSDTRCAAAMDMGANIRFPADSSEPVARRWDRVIEASGNTGGLALATQLVAPSGTIACVSLYGRDSIPIDLDSMVTRDVTIRGVLGSPHCWDEVIELVRAQRLTPGSLITRRFALEHAAEAFDQIGRPDELKVVITMNEDIESPKERNP